MCNPGKSWHALDTAPHDLRILVKSESGEIYAEELELTDLKILEACARACGYAYCDPIRAGKFRVASSSNGLSFDWTPLESDGDCARMENKCGARVNCHSGGVFLVVDGFYVLREEFTPGNDAERRRASCLVVARSQLEKEKTRHEAVHPNRDAQALSQEAEAASKQAAPEARD